MFVIGLTGGIGSGKSTVSDMLRAKGAAVVYADQVGHEVYRPGTAVWERLSPPSGARCLAADGQIDRRKLGSIVFADPEARRRLNAITHPPMQPTDGRAPGRVAAAGRARGGAGGRHPHRGGLGRPGGRGVADAGSAGGGRPAPMERSGLSQEEAEARIASQLSNEERLEHAEVVIDTDCSLAEVARRVDELWDGLMAASGGQSNVGGRR